jgi:outer membrane cobalamin receptor
VHDDATLRLLAPACAVAAFLVAPAAKAQAPTPASGIEEVHVTGDRSPVQTGTSVAAVSRDDVKSLPGGDALSLTQVVLTQPGFAPDSFGGDGVLHIRGAEMGVLYVVDGVPLPPGLAGQFVDVLPTGLVQNMRLITGGQPVEYGPNSGGVVDVATRRGTGAPAGEVQMLYGTYQRVQPSAWYSQAFGNADVFVAASFLGTQRGLDPPAATPVLHDGMQSGTAFARVDYRPGELDRIEILARYAEQHLQIPIDPTLLPLSDAPRGAMRGPDVYANAPPPFVPYDADPTETERDVFAALSYTRVVGRGSVQLSPYVRSSYGDLHCDAAGSLGATADPGSVCSSVTRRMLHAGETMTYAQAVGDSQRWKAGLSLDQGWSSVDYTQYTRDDALAASGADPALTLAGRDDTNVVLGGAFLQDEITIGPAKLLPGVRFDFQRATFEGTTQLPLVLAGPSARLGFTYAFSRKLTLHASAGYLWQPPNAVDAAVAARVLLPGLAAQPVDLKAQRDIAGEIGLTYRVPRCFDATLTAYGRTSQDQLDMLSVGSTTLFEAYNYANGRAVGAELTVHARPARYVSGFSNASFNIAQGQGVDSERYLFTPDQLSYSGWKTLDHTQVWTVNAGIDLHDASQASHLAVLYQYGSGLRTGANNNETVPGHSTWNLTLRHRFDMPLHPEVAVDVLNAFDAVYAIRIANGLVGSAYGPLRQVDVRLSVPFGG